MTTESTLPPGAVEPTAVQIAAAMAQGVLASGLAGPWGIAGSSLVGGALQLAQMWNGSGKVVTMAELEASAKTTGANVDAFSAKVDAKFPT